jgi:hypothetical protein
MALRRAFRIIVVLLACLLVGGLAAAPRAGAGSTALRAGLGYRLPGGDFVGFYLTSAGTKVYCLDPRKAEPSGIVLRPVHRYPGTTAAATAELAYALARWGDAGSAWSAAVESQVLNTLAGNTADVGRRAEVLAPSVAARVAVHVAAARRWHGPYSLHVRVARALGPGQSGHGTAWVVAATGQRVPGLTLDLTARAAAVPARVHTGADGRARFRYSVTGAGEVRITATAVGLAGTSILASRPASYQQHMITGRPLMRTSGSTTFQRRPNAFAHRYACTTTCDGRPSVSLTGCAPPSRYPSRLEYLAGDHLHSVLFAASATRRCATITLTLRDGDRVTAAWRYRIGGGWSRAVPLPGAFTVDCPPVPAVAVALSYDCARAWVRIALADIGAAGSWTPLVNHTRHRLMLIIGGAVNRHIAAGPGQSAIFTATADCSAPLTYTAQAAVQRSGGGYNYGPVAAVTTPGPSAPAAGR